MVANLIVAIPVKDEAERIADCLTALAWQREVRHHQILLLLNNCRDDTEAAVRNLAPALPVKIHIVTRDFPPTQSNAGQARRAALQCAELLLDPDGILVTTDADGCAAPDWLANTLAAFRRGADAVAGRAVIDPVEALAIPSHLHDDDALECAYAALLDEIESMLDPDDADVWPRHTEHSGASLAVRLSCYRRAGGIPAIPLGEDRAFIGALRRIDARIRHACDVTVTVSGRLEGRAAGGMADTMRRRTVAQDPDIDDRLEPAGDHARRIKLRARCRAAWRTGAPDPVAAAALHLPAGDFQSLLLQRHFGAGWALVEAQSPTFRHRRTVARSALVGQSAVASILRDQLRSIIRRAADRSDNLAPASAISA